MSIFKLLNRSPFSRYSAQESANPENRNEIPVITESAAIDLPLFPNEPVYLVQEKDDFIQIGLSKFSYSAIVSLKGNNKAIGLQAGEIQNGVHENNKRNEQQDDVADHPKCLSSNKNTFDRLEMAKANDLSNSKSGPNSGIINETGDDEYFYESDNNAIFLKPAQILEQAQFQSKPFRANSPSESELISTTIQDLDESYALQEQFDEKLQRCNKKSVLMKEQRKSLRNNDLCKQQRRLKKKLEREGRLLFGSRKVR